ncbi:MAG: UDP-glucose 6-dehydrogenase [Gammaproteobacteria bacterium BRH_c0]|nr:MAG: UDP-glucose 6-dehydrogenase [Gammaproteobacteria bacterium BRH_c0]
MKVTVMGSGYVGLVTGACLAHVGHQVMCFDIDEARIASLNSNHLPLFEPGLDSVIASGVREGLLSFSSDAEEAIGHGQVIFIAVGTPQDHNGAADTRHVMSAAGLIGQYMKDYALVVTKSTVPVGTTDRVRETVARTLQARHSPLAFDVASNPEFLKEGSAVNDFMKPDRILVGTESKAVEKILRQLYAPFNRNHERLMVMDIRSAELTKYAANAMLATKISFINEIANIAERMGADIEKVRQGIGADPRIGYHFIYPGCGYGGSCFPKDVAALEASAIAEGYRPQLLRAVREVNARQKERLFEKISDYFRGDLKGKTIALWGLSFKPRTDDMREAPSRMLMESLWDAGAQVRAYDPQAAGVCQQIYGQRQGLTLVDSKEAALEGADALAICTEWKSFWAPDFALIRATLATPVIFDGRNLFEPDCVISHGLDYVGIGRIGVVQAQQSEGRVRSINAA